MPKRRRFSDVELLAWVVADRAEFGACTTSTLARRAGVAQTYVWRRVDALTRAGRILRDPKVPGSIRPA